MPTHQEIVDFKATLSRSTEAWDWLSHDRSMLFEKGSGGWRWMLLDTKGFCPDKIELLKEKIHFGDIQTKDFPTRKAAVEYALFIFQSYVEKPKVHPLKAFKGSTYRLEIPGGIVFFEKPFMQGWQVSKMEDQFQRLCFWNVRDGIEMCWGLSHCYFKTLNKAIEGYLKIEAETV